MSRQLGSGFESKGPGSILDMPGMKYFPGHNALYIKYVLTSRAHDKIYMVHGDGYLKGFKAAESQTPNLPSPPFSISMVTLLGSSCFLASFKAKKPPRHKGKTTQSHVSPPSCLCVLVVPSILRPGTQNGVFIT